MALSTPCAPFERLKFSGTITLIVSATHIVIPTGNLYTLMNYNEWTVNRELLTPGTKTFTNDTDINTGLKNMVRPWISWFDQSTSIVYFVLFTHKPTNLSCVVDTNGIITSITLYPGNGSIYYGTLRYPNLTLI